ncbi:MAG: hypothetical protein SVS85_01825 [Candidatus Nanohaloarchaea archaeon]|nr:hypothetical protein [Candidatus Nanohaloarchaea archaeon]
MTGLLVILGLLLAILRPDLMGFSQSANQSVTNAFGNISDLM